MNPDFAKKCLPDGAETDTSSGMSTPEHEYARELAAHKYLSKPMPCSRATRIILLASGFGWGILLLLVLWALS